jgi:hypothetical protein
MGYDSLSQLCLILRESIRHGNFERMVKSNGLCCFLKICFSFLRLKPIISFPRERQMTPLSLNAWSPQIDAFLASYLTSGLEVELVRSCLSGATLAEPAELRNSTLTEHVDLACALEKCLGIQPKRLFACRSLFELF